MKTLTVKVPEPLLADIETSAKERRVSKSEIIRERLEQGAGSSKTSLWNRMEDLLIDDDSLPRDLSSSKRHLEDYGKNRPD